MKSYYEITEALNTHLSNNQITKTVTIGDITDVDLNKRSIFPLAHIIVNGSPRDYKLGFYGNASRLKEYAGNDTLKDLDLSAYDHSYEASVILDGFGSDITEGSIGLFSGAVIYPLFSPVRNWIYNSANSNHEANNIAKRISRLLNLC